MKFIANLFNGLLMALMLFMLYTHGWPSGLDFWLFMLCWAAPITSVIALWQQADKERGNWISLFIKRKALEERHKIAKLTPQASDQAEDLR